MSWHREALDQDEWCNCLGAVDNIHDDDYELTSCKVQGMSLKQWILKCESIEYCGENALEILGAHVQCQNLVTILTEEIKMPWKSLMFLRVLNQEVGAPKYLKKLWKASINLCTKALVVVHFKG